MSDLPCDESPTSLASVQERTAQRCVPFSAAWELTYRCNLACRHCYVLQPPTADGELTTAECMDALEQLAEAGFFFLILTGGEVLTRPDFFELAAEARRLTFALRIMTNGTLVDASVADGLAGLSPCSVDISLYGRPAAHDAITRVPGSQERALGAIRLLRERGLFVRVKSPMMRSNIGEYEHLRETAREFGCGFVFDSTVCPADDGGQGPLAERLDLQGVMELYRRAGGGKPMPKGGNHVHGEPICNAGRNTARIKPDGQVTPCIAIRESIGSLRRRRLVEIWSSIGFKKYRTMTPEKLPECVECRIRDFCVRCPGVAECETGDLYGRSPGSCTVAEARSLMFEGALR